MRSLAFVTLTASLALLAGEASAHIQLVSPVQRHTEQKSGPCGVGPNDTRGPNVTTYKPGEKIVVTFDEHVNHPGHFRISFDDDGHDGFADPQGYDDFYTNEYVLLDDIADKDGGIYEIEVTLPNIECENCTLQVQQTMTDKPPFGPGGGVDFYWQCADIRLAGDVAETTTGEPGTTTGDETASTGGAADDSTSSTGAAAESTADPGPEPTDGEGGLSSTSGASSDGSTGGVGSDASTGGVGSDTTGGTTTPQAPDDDKGCGCRGDEAGGAGWLALLLLAWRRRRG